VDGDGCATGVDGDRCGPIGVDNWCNADDADSDAGE
jgi:hypothetical protein